MKHLEFKRKYLKSLISGEKRSTIRKRAYVKPDEHVYIHCGGMVIGKARIISVRKLRIEDIGDEIARMEGFSNKYELLNELNSYYSNSGLYLIEFDFEKFSKPLSPYEMHYEKRSLMDVASEALKLEEMSPNERKIIELFLETGSIRKTAFRLGGLSKRDVVRETIRKAFRVVRGQKNGN